MEPQLSHLKILIVEDDPDIGRIAQIVLEKAGYPVRLANNGHLALEYVSEDRPYLIVCDVMMPEMDGLELLSILKKDRATKAIPVMMMSALTSDGDVRLGQLGGAEYYLKKPFTAAQLLAAVKGVFATVSVRERLLASFNTP